MNDQFKCLVNMALQNAHMGNTNNAVLFIGETRTGKSAFIAYLLGCNMAFKDVGASTDILIATDCPTDQMPVIGHQPISQTLFPSGYTYEGNTYIDLPGLQDTRTSDAGLLGLLATQVAIQTSNLIKHVVIVIDYNDIKNKNAKNLASIVTSMSKLFKDFKQHRADISLVVTKLHGIKDGSIEQKKKRIIVDLTAFNDAIKQDNYQTEISDPQQVREFLDLFINSKSLSNLILFDPLQNTAKSELLSAIGSNTGFSPKEITFVGDESHKQQFVAKIEGSLTEAIEVLNRLVSHPNDKAKLEDELAHIKKKISNLDTETKKTKQDDNKESSGHEKETDSSMLHSEETLKAKRNDIKDSELELKRLVAQSEISKDKLQGILDTKKQVEDILVWNEEDDYPGDKGTTLSRHYTLSRNVTEGPFQIYEDDYTIDCITPQILYESNRCPEWHGREVFSYTFGRADNYKDGSIRCFHNRKTIVGYFQSRYNNTDPAAVFLFSKTTPIIWKRAHWREHYIHPKSTEGYLEQKTANNVSGIFNVTYHTPSDCYGRIKVTFLVDYHNKLEVKEEMKKLNKKIKKLEKSIATNDKDMREAELTLLEMEDKNKQAIDAQKKSSHKYAEQQKRFSANSAHLARLKAEQSSKQNFLDTLQITYDADFKTYCSQQEFWQKLIDLNTVIQFQLPQYATFSSQFSIMSGRVSKQDCIGFIEPLICNALPDLEDFEYVDDCIEDEEIIYANGIATNPINKARVVYDKDRGFLAAKHTLGYQFFKWSNLLVTKGIYLPYFLVSQLSNYAVTTASAYVNSPAVMVSDVSPAIMPTSTLSIFGARKPAEPESICIPTHGNSEFDYTPSLTCSGPGYQAIVFATTSDSTSVSTSYLNGNSATISGDTYDNCKPINFAGRPSVTCEGNQTTMVYTPDIKPGPMDELGSSVMLLSVFAQWGKNIGNWVTSEPPKVVEKEVRFGISEEERLARTKQVLRIKALETEISDFKKYISHPGAQFLSLSKKYLHDFCDDIENDLNNLKLAFKSHKDIDEDLSQLETKIPSMRTEIDSEIDDILSPTKQVSNASICAARNTTFFRPNRANELGMLAITNSNETRANTSMSALTR